MFFGKIQNIQVGFINQLDRTMKIVVWKMWISRNETHFKENCNNFRNCFFYSFKSKGVVD